MYIYIYIYVYIYIHAKVLDVRALGQESADGLRGLELRVWGLKMGSLGTRAPRS